MFCILKANNEVGESYASESTAPPFGKKREGQMSKVACTNCRISKLRCSGGPGCCRRCFSKRFSCEYPSPAWSSSSGSQIQTSQSTSTATTMTPQMSGITEMVSSVDDSIHDFLDLPTPGPGDPKTPTDHCADHHFAQELEAPRRSQQQHHHMLTATTQGTYTFDPDLTTDISDLVFDSPTGPRTPTNNTLSSSSSTRRSCSCQMQAMSTNEAIEIISWSQKDSCSDIYDVLQRQKAALGRFEDLLGCRECTVQPSYVMMLLSMYQRLLETLEKMSRGPGEEGDNDDDDDGGDGGVEWRKRNRDDSYENRSSSAGGSTGQRGGYGISIRRQRLDDDDESLVLKSLVIMRAKMLRRIVVRVDELVSQHNWPVHKRICRELQSLLDSVLMA